MKNTMRKIKVVRGVVVIAISAGLSLWNMQSQEVVALAPVSEQSVPGATVAGQSAGGRYCDNDM